MKKQRTLLFYALCFLVSCNAYSDPKKQETPSAKVGDSKIIGVITNKDGSKKIDIILRRIFKNIKTDSVSKVDIIITDTIFGINIGTDSVSKSPVYAAIGKDSINTEVSNIPIDSLLKSKK